MGRNMGGFGGGANMQNIIKQAQKMQQQMQKAQEELAETEVTATVGGGMVEATMTGDKKLVNISINPDAVDPDDVETLEDLIVAAVNEATNLVDEKTQEVMGPYANMGNMGLF